MEDFGDLKKALCSGYAFCETDADSISKAVAERDKLLLQVRELQKALYAECVGSACAPAGQCFGGYRKCSGCEERAKIAYGPGWGEYTEKWKPETIEDLLGECRECNRLCRDCGNHGPVQS